VFDTQPFSSRVSFYGDRVGLSPTVTGLAESEIVKLVFETPMFVSLVLDELSLPGATSYSLTVRSPFTTPSEKPGDIDVLLASEQAPNNGVALECKRVKVRTSTDGDQRINKLEAFGASYDQANALHALGFGRTFLTAISVVDGRFEPERNFLFRGASPQTFQRLFETAVAVPLDGGIGVLYIELAQPVSAPIQSAAVFSVAVIREAGRREQSSATTGMIAKYLATNGQMAARNEALRSDVTNPERR
jgi:hypothetical protein